eukprot:5609290-Prymnesium_polylepis.2
MGLGFPVRRLPPTRRLPPYTPALTSPLTPSLHTDTWQTLHLQSHSLPSLMVMVIGQRGRLPSTISHQPSAITH